MIDINAEAEKSLSDVKCKAVFQYPKNFNNLPIISYYTVTECGGFYADNDESIQDGHIQLTYGRKFRKNAVIWRQRSMK
jgi:hypothetical protein